MRLIWSLSRDNYRNFKLARVTIGSGGVMRTGRGKSTAWEQHKETPYVAIFISN
jgi:hypothetical protein